MQLSMAEPTTKFESKHRCIKKFVRYQKNGFRGMLCLANLGILSVVGNLGVVGFPVFML